MIETCSNLFTLTVSDSFDLDKQNTWIFLGDYREACTRLALPGKNEVKNQALLKSTYKMSAWLAPSSGEYEKVWNGLQMQ